ncbi:hypothetical protein [Paenibacillus sp. P22]|uniref:hypothetical protein n=1 Tax=Paenibacillus TaxID=44249 RepID=UPI00038F7BD0|nr:hypothetical protein [Paenibacillus sp. P22]CDN45036.1 hypothetical protein BN871_GG_00050 [Paenibacillus sp. P22]
MKEAIITNLEGLLADVALVDDRETGYLPIYETQGVPKGDEQPELKLNGYRVAVPVPSGLYRPRFAREVYDAYQAALAAYRDDLASWESLSDMRGERPLAPVAQAFWIEGLTPEEIEALQPPPPEPSPIEQLQANNAALLLDLAETQARQQQAEQDNMLLQLQQAESKARIQIAEQDHADLLLQLVEGGVL